MNRDQQGRTALHYAAVDGDVPAIVRLISDGADVGAVDRALMTPLHLSCQQEQSRRRGC
ncbi:ankyrin repeat domain-containing protein [Intrasporangium oryzae]|uniref:ankyrin repeat domain-containing protein n=1 Tax=Intrasporangium oryzae TaxID=412687 RepID=UPI0004B70C11|nr:ankyrin repeat domain-containing protein [Intrasporangium oryzae]